MRVKRLEIQGFKSFKDKTVIQFDHGITGIVGPNGCGKSNIVDAFFWVMGEQSYKHMRGSSSDDLIFNGSSKYNPLGMAEATIVLDTGIPDLTESGEGPTGATFDLSTLPIHLRSKEVAVTRRLYRSGEGEYFINGITARLKDIQELFMDTGVGAKGYSIIEQGQIGKIVNAKPEDRRLLIEEAAGIAKYKARKKESLRKMEATQANLSRLQDVISEIERNLGSLERQAQKARQYKKYKDELLDKEMTWGRRKTKLLKQRLEEITRGRQAMEQDLVGLRAELQTAENDIETDRVDQVTDSKLAEELQTRIQHLSGELARERSALDLSRRRQSDLSTQRQALDQEKTELDASITAENTRVAVMEEDARVADQAFASSSGRVRALGDAVDALRARAETARRELDSARNELMAGITRSSELASRGASIATRIESCKMQSERLAQQAQALQEKLASSQEEATAAQVAAGELRARRESLRAETQELAAQLRSREQEVKAHEKESERSHRAATQLKSKLQSLEELADTHEGFADGPKAALDWAREQGTADKLVALADSLEVSEGYDLALEGWLENELQSLIALDPAIALGAVAELNRSRQGRAAIRLTQAPASGAGSESGFKKIKGLLEKAGFSVRGELAEFVRTDERHGADAQAAAARTLERVAIVEDLAPAAAFVSGGGLERLSGWSIVGIDGAALDSVGRLRGGQSGSGESTQLLRRKRAIIELRSESGAAETAHSALEETLTQSRHGLELARERLLSSQSELQQLEIEAAALERDVQQGLRSVKENEKSLEQAHAEIEEMRETTEQAFTDREAIALQLEDTQSGRAALEEKITALDSQSALHEQEYRAQDSELQSLRVGEASQRERASGLKRELETSRSVIADRTRRMAEIERTLERAIREHDQFTGDDPSLEVRIEGLVRSLAVSREELSGIKDRLEQSSAKVNQALDRIKGLHKSGDEKTSEANQLALEIEKVGSDLGHLIQNLEEKYGPGCLERPSTSPVQEEMEEPVVTAEMSAEEERALGEEVERLRERIRRLGEVNVSAIEDYEETKKRFDFLYNEKQDLEKSLENLREAIEHINRTSEERFRKAFETIADRFERLFPIIFGGGQARLSLVYPEGSTDILEAGVDILAQPPGKKIVNIGLLSGGEKALTAVSLIFAIFMVKPSPFCVLDEVDAPLDDANIGKFNALLREMAAKSQFILITHNKKSMELNDTLYGVTMEEPGVSKMISIEMQ